MNPVGADQHVAVRGGAMAAGAVEEISGDAGFILTEGAKPMAGVGSRVAEPRANRLVDDALQASAVNRKLRHVITGVEPARLAPDLLAETIGIEQLVGADADLVEPRQKPERGELLDGVRQRVDADPELVNAVGLFEDFAIDAARVQHQRGCEPTNAAAGDEDLHDGLFCQSRLAAQLGSRLIAW